MSNRSSDAALGPGDAGAPPRSGLHRWLIFAAAVFPASIYVGAQTVANAVLPQMQGDLSAGLDQISWVVTASVVATAIGIPPTAWLAARFGRRRIMVTGMLGFAACGAMVGTADTLAGVVFWRALSALCAAPMTALSQAVTLDTFPEEQRGAAFAFWGIGILSGWVFAPALGAYVAELHSWRLIFFLLAPAGMLGALTASLTRETEIDQSLRFDWFGFAALSAGLGFLLVVLNRGQRLDWFESSEIIAFAVAGGFALYVFVVHTTLSKQPFLNWRVFLDRNFRIGLLVVSTYAGISLAPLVLIPTMLVELRGLELLTTGLVLIPRGLAQILGLVVVSRFVNRADARVWMVGGLVSFSVSGFYMAGFNLDVGIADVVWPNLMQGFAMAFIWAPAANLIYANMGPSMRTDATTLMSLIYALSSSIGVSISVTVLTRTFQRSHEELASRVVPGSEVLRLPEWSGHWDLSTVNGLLSAQAEVVQQALMIGYVNVFWATALFALCVIPFSLFLRKD